MTDSDLHYITLEVKAGDLLPVPGATLYPDTNDWTGTTVEIQYKRRPTKENPDIELVTREAIFVPPSGVRYDWIDYETDIPGTYDACWVFKLADGRTFSNNFIFKIVESPPDSDGEAPRSKREYEWL